MICGPRQGIRANARVELNDGTSITEGFLADKPKTKLRGALHQQLGLEMTPMNITKANPPFDPTSLKGVFATGDCAHVIMQTVTSALDSGTCTGGGARLEIQSGLYS
ncbi:hypothetical protein F4824DRAFT_501106 [Ustulina deusta]|nr:hypothetical protein F4823DRAFT_638073 [Ustulina deusta]KAI3335480.1 hypothetical protein F4824DRAFT_501106 [Ustulina deusta]